MIFEISKRVLIAQRDSRPGELTLNANYYNEHQVINHRRNF